MWVVALINNLKPLSQRCFRLSPAWILIQRSSGSGSTMTERGAVADHLIDAFFPLTVLRIFIPMNLQLL